MAGQRLRWCVLGLALLAGFPAARATPMPPPVQLLGEISLFSPEEQTRLHAGAALLADASGAPVCVIMARTGGGFDEAAAVCRDAVVVGLALEDKNVVLTVPPRTALSQKLTPTLLRQIEKREIVPLLRKGYNAGAAEGLLKGLDTLTLVAQGRYEQLPNPTARFLWLPILLVTIAGLWLLARHSQGRGRGAGRWIGPQHHGTDLHFPAAPSPEAPPPVAVTTHRATTAFPPLEAVWTRETCEALRDLLPEHPTVHLHVVDRPANTTPREAAADFQRLGLGADGAVVFISHRPAAVAVATGGGGVPEETLRTAAGHLSAAAPLEALRALLAALPHRQG